MPRKVVVATEKPFSTNARDKVMAVLQDAKYQVVVVESYKAKGDLMNAVADADALIVRSDKVDADVLAAGKNLKLVVRAGAGYDNIDCAKAKLLGIAVMNTPGQNANAVAELAFAMMVFMARGKFDGKTGSELRGKSLGLHAFGAVGRASASIAKGIGMTVRAFDPLIDKAKISECGVEPLASPEDLYKKSDYLSLQMPANKETKGIVGKSLIPLLPKNATLVNTARCEVINEADLVAAMTERTDLRYCTDCEPSPEVHKALGEKFATRYFCTPKKMGAQTNEANLNSGIAAAKQIVGFFEHGARDFIVNR